VQRRLGQGLDISSRCLSFVANAQLKESNFNAAINSMSKAVFREPTNLWVRADLHIDRQPFIHSMIGP
jgi:hypothetical protein